MRQINLLPPEIARRRQARRAASLGVVGIGIVIALMLVFYLFQAGRLSNARNALTDQTKKNASLQADVDQLSRFADQQQELANRKSLLTGLTQDEVRWSVILSDIATFIPSDVWLTNLTGSVQSQAPGTKTTGSGGGTVATTYGSIQFAGCTLTPTGGTHLEVAKFLVRIGVPQVFTNVYLSLSSKGSKACPVTFNSSVNLTPDALRHNQRGGERNP